MLIVLRKVNICWVILATIILLLHNILPHQHHGEMSEQAHTRQHQSSNFLDVLCSVFHLDLGDHLHLENIALAQATDGAKTITECVDRVNIDNGKLVYENCLVVFQPILDIKFRFQHQSIIYTAPQKRQVPFGKTSAHKALKRLYAAHALRAPPVWS